MIYGPDDPPSILYQHLNISIINKIILENPLCKIILVVNSLKKITVNLFF